MKSIVLILAFTFSFLNFSIEKSAFYDALSSNSVEKLDKISTPVVLWVV